MSTFNDFLFLQIIHDCLLFHLSSHLQEPVFGIFNTWPGILVALDLLVYWGNQSISENVSSSWSTLSMIVWLTNFFQFVQNSVTTYSTLITTLSGVMVQYSVVPEKSCTCWPLIIQSSCALIVPAPRGTAPQDLSLIGGGIEHSLVGSGSSTKLRWWRTEMRWLKTEKQQQSSEDNIWKSAESRQQNQKLTNIHYGLEARLGEGQRLAQPWECHKGNCQGIST